MGLDIYISRVTGSDETAIVHLRKNYLAQAWMDVVLGNPSHASRPIEVSFVTLESIRMDCNAVLSSKEWKAELAKVIPELQGRAWTPEQENACRDDIQELSDSLAQIQPPSTGTKLIYHASW